MRSTVQDLIDELSKCNPRASINFQVGVSSNNGPILMNHVARVDRIADATVTVVVEKGV